MTETQPNLPIDVETPSAPAAPPMPEGYYSGDQPNPNLRAFVEKHLADHPYDPETDAYDVPAFNVPLDATKATAIYNMHTYWSKKPHDAIRTYIRHYTQPGDLVLDPFCGSGGTALAALLEGRAAIAIDRSPAATFITKNYCTPVDLKALQKAFEELKARVKPEIDWLYETRCDRCGSKAATAYTVYSQVFQCPRCLEKVALFDCAEADALTAAGKPKTIRVCPHCRQRGHEQEISTRLQQLGAIPVLVSYLCESGCKSKRDERRHNDTDQKKREYFKKYDLGKLAEIETAVIPYWYPLNKMMNVMDDSKPWGAEWREGRNFRTVAALFTKRNLWALAAIRKCLPAYDHLTLAFNSIVLNSSKLYRHREAGGGGPNGNYYIAQDHREMSVWPQIEDKIKEIERSFCPFSSAVMISTQSALRFPEIDDNTIDFIFTDPPYSDTVQYGELNFIWESWLGLDTKWHDEEIIVNGVRGRTVADWADMMRAAMSECFRVLKPGRWLSLCYHDTSEGTWTLVQEISQEAGFIVDQSDEALYIETGQKSYNQTVADKVTKRDLVINFRKPRVGETVETLLLTGNEDEATFHERARAILRDYLAAHPGETKDRAYDHLVSRMVRRGQMEAHDFDELLRSVAEAATETTDSGAARWYLQEAENAAVDRAETAKEESAAERLRPLVAERSRLRGGVDYSDLFERYLFALKDARERPRRSLAEWLPDFFPFTEAGLYRLPEPEEEQRLAAMRAQGVSRRIKRYVTCLQQGVPIPPHERQTDTTLAQWISHCRTAGLYQQGALLYEKGGLHLDALPATLYDRVEMDYALCARRAAAPAPEAKPKRKAKRDAEPTLF